MVKKNGETTLNQTLWASVTFVPTDKVNDLKGFYYKGREDGKKRVAKH